MTIKSHAQIATLLTFQVSLCESLRQFMNAQTASEPSRRLTQIILSQMQTMNQVQQMTRELVIEAEDGGDKDSNF